MTATEQSRPTIEQVRCALDSERKGKAGDVEQILQAIDRDALKRMIDGSKGQDAPKGRQSAITVAAADRHNPNVSIENKLITFARDSFICRYCNKPLILVAALRALSEQHTQVFPYHTNWKLEGCHPIYWTHGAICGHMKAIASGGTPDLDNLVTVCPLCMYKTDAPPESGGRTLQAVPVSRSWNGLCGEFRELCFFKLHIRQIGDLQKWYDALLA